MECKNINFFSGILKIFSSLISLRYFNVRKILWGSKVSKGIIPLSLSLEWQINYFLPAAKQSTYTLRPAV